MSLFYVPLSHICANPAHILTCSLRFNNLFDLASAEAKVAALRAAVGTVTKRVRAAASGNGCERHLYALKSIAARDGLAVPAFFGSKAWATLNHTKLSESMHCQ